MSITRSFLKFLTVTALAAGMLLGIHAITQGDVHAGSYFKHEAFTILNPVKNGTYDLNEKMLIQVQRDKWIAKYVDGWLQNDYNYVFIDVCKDGEVLKRIEVKIFYDSYSPGTTEEIEFTPTKAGTYEMRIGFATSDVERTLLLQEEKVTEDTFVGKYTFDVVKRKANTLTVKASAKTVKAAALRKAKKTVKPVTISKGKGAVTVKKVKEGTTASIYGKITVNKKNGAITLKKGKYKAGTYKVRLEVTAAGDKGFKPKTVTRTAKIKIK